MIGCYWNITDTSVVALVEHCQLLREIDLEEVKQMIETVGHRKDSVVVKFNQSWSPPQAETKSFEDAVKPIEYSVSVISRFVNDKVSKSSGSS